MIHQQLLHLPDASTSLGTSPDKITISIFLKGFSHPIQQSLFLLGKHNKYLFLDEMANRYAA